MSEVSSIANERSIAFFGFSIQSLVDSVYNVFPDSWEEVCNEEFKTVLNKLSENGRLRVVSLPFMTESLGKTFQKMQRYFVSDIFKVPDAVILPPCKKMHLALATAEKTSKQLEDEFAAKLEKIRLLRIKLEERQHKIEGINRSIEVLDKMEKAQTVLAENQNSVGENSQPV